MYAKIVFAGAMVGALSLSAITTSAYAQSPTRIKQHKAWGAYSVKNTDGTICYVLSVPTEKQPADRDHGDVFFMLARHPGQATSLEPQFKVGYPFAEKSNVTLDIDGKKFAMYTQGGNAWMENPAEESNVVEAMRAGSNMSLEGKSRRGTVTSYKYSLSGVTASIKEIETCQ